MPDNSPVSITYFSDVLCIWAYATQIRLDEIGRNFGADVRIDYKFCSVFGNTADKIARGWAGKGGYQGFNRHLQDVAGQFDHINVHPEVWLTTQPASSDSVHLFIKAVQLLEQNGALAGPVGGRDAAPSPQPALCAQITWALRHAFFHECRDVSTRRVQCEVAEEIGIAPATVAAKIDSGAAFAALAADAQARDRLRIEGSPTFVLNQGRQKLYGNVGYRVIEANIRELLRTPSVGEMSWC